jgi:hypothetical protein
VARRRTRKTEPVHSKNEGGYRRKKEKRAGQVAKTGGKAIDQSHKNTASLEETKTTTPARNDTRDTPSDHEATEEETPKEEETLVSSSEEEHKKKKRKKKGKKHNKGKKAKKSKKDQRREARQSKRRGEEKSGSSDSDSEDEPLVRTPQQKEPLVRTSKRTPTRKRKLAKNLPQLGDKFVLQKQPGDICCAEVSLVIGPLDATGLKVPIIVSGKGTTEGLIVAKHGLSSRESRLSAFFGGGGGTRDWKREGLRAARPVF